MISGSALSLNDMLIALTLPDLYPVLQTIMVKLNPQSFLPVQLPKMGCSSFIYQGDKFLYGRNLDFPGVGYWDKYPVIQLTERKNCLRHIDFTTAGVPFGGITGINEAQISVSLHQHYGKNYDLTGVAPFVIGEEILDKAKTLNEAKDLIRARKIASCWAFLITDGKSKKRNHCRKKP
jgi:penicillin V acylase-like amidase (Ntn superfamily)